MQRQKSSIQGILSKRQLQIVIFFLLLVVSAVVVVTLHPQKSQSTTQQSNYAIHAQQNFNQPQYYPTAQIPSHLYRPIDNWVGRLILPSQQEIQSGSDWVWFEVQSAPPDAQHLIGKVVRLEWKNKPEIQSYIHAVTRDVHLTPATKASVRQGLVHPIRLDNRLQVGPLQSLAGSRPNDDVIVTIDHAELGSELRPDTLSVHQLQSAVQNPKNLILQIEQEPVLATGRFYGLVKILKPQTREFFRVRHYNPVSGHFDAQEETIRIPQQVLDTRNIPPSTPHQIEKSPAGNAGWYIYGAKDSKGMFVVQAISPRALFQLQPEQVVLGKESGLTYIKEHNWQNTKENKGTIRKVLVDGTETGAKQALSAWREGDRAVVLHLFGGIGGKKGESLSIPSTVTGHFAFGLAQVIRDPFTNELQFAIQYEQVYAHNPDGIIAGKHFWADFMGNLQWGWMATRPVADVLIKFDPVTQDYDFEGIKLSPLSEFLYQLQVMMARYRVGDGTGSATVSIATSCVQDSSQALYAAIKVIQQQVTSNPKIQQWLSNHPNDPQTLRFQQLVSLGASFEQELLPLGIVRADWESNASFLTGTGNDRDPFRDRSIWAGLTSWRTMFPRQAHDELASIFLKHGAKLWFLRTNQVGGWNPDITPLTPTALFGQIVIPFTNVSPIPIIFNRILGSLALPDAHDWLVAVGVVLVYAAIALPLGFRSGFLQFHVWSTTWNHQLLAALRCLITPAITEEFIFRVLLLPHPHEVVNWMNWGLWAVFSLILFIVYHPVNAKTYFKAGFPTFFDRVFLTLAGLLGLACTVAYALTGSFWVIVFIHWIVVVVWLLTLRGMQKLMPD